MKNDENQILDGEDFWTTKDLSNRQLAGLVQTKIKYPNYILSKIDAEIIRRDLDKNDLLKEILLQEDTSTSLEKLFFFCKNNKTATILLSLISLSSLFSIPWVFLVIIFSIYFSLKKNHNSDK